MSFIINKKTKIILSISFLLLSILFVQNGLAQLTSQAQEEQIKEEQKTMEDEAVKELQKTEEPTKKEVDYFFKYGGWITSYYWRLDDLNNTQEGEDWLKDMWLQDFRLWAIMELYQTLTVYSRLRYYHVENRTREDYTGEQDGIYGPYLDMGYLKYDLKPRHNMPFEITVGRQYLTLGRGITYSNVHDGIQIKTEIGGNGFFKTFGSKNKPHDSNLDYSAPDYKKRHRRRFWGSELAYSGIVRHLLYGYLLVQRDFSYQKQEGLQKYHYNSRYYGLGASGEPIDDLKYWAEVIKEYGYTYTDRKKTSHRKCRINSWAYNLGAKYHFNVITHPALEVETAYGSGDKDRKRVTNVRHGNIADDDTNFLYFGRFSAGYALAPRLSNMYIYKVGCSMKPFEVCKFLNLDNIVLGAKYYFYHKDKRTGGIYDIEATQYDKFVGQELDLYLYYKIYHNLYYSMRYGLFLPGSAYAEDAKETSKYFLARLTLLF